MMVFYTSAAKHLASELPFEQGNYLSKQFSDGEWYIKLEQDVYKKNVWVIAATNPPAEHLLELFLLLNALARAQATINILFTYFGYARQDSPVAGEASSAEVVGTILKIFALKKIIVIHAHSSRLHHYLNFTNVIPTDLIRDTMQLYDAVAAPDQGAHDLVKSIAHACGKESIFLTKIRSEQEKVKILEYDGIVPSRKILIIDDMIATGNTIIEVAKILAQLGADDIGVWATHGIFSGDAIELLNKSIIKKIFVTNTLPQDKKSPKIEVISIAPLIKQIIAEN